MLERGAFTITEFCDWSRISRALTYEKIAAGELPVVKIGMKTLVRRADAEEFLERNLQIKGRYVHPDAPAK